MQRFLQASAGGSSHSQSVRCRRALGGLVSVRGGNGLLCYAFSRGRKPKTSADICAEQRCRQLTHALPADVHKQRVQKPGPAAASVCSLAGASGPASMSWPIPDELRLQLRTKQAHICALSPGTSALPIPTQLRTILTLITPMIQPFCSFNDFWLKKRLIPDKNCTTDNLLNLNCK